MNIIDELSKMYDDEANILKAIDDDVLEVEKQIAKQIVELIERYDKERLKCELFPYGARLITESINDEIKRLDELIDKIYEKVV